MRYVIVTVLVLAVLGSAVGVVVARHQSRELFIEMQALERDRDRMQVQWGRLQLEVSTWATHGRIESLARKKLDMEMPGIDREHQKISATALPGEGLR